jgi:surface polysaccharide O-acyltransferase-like enzyme
VLGARGWYINTSVGAPTLKATLEELSSRGSPATHSHEAPIKDILFGPAWYHLWFLYLILGLYLFSPVIKQFLFNCPRKMEKYALLLFIVIGTGIPFINALLPILEQPFSFLPQGSFTNLLAEVTGYGGIFLAGHYFMKYDVSKRTTIVMIAAGIIGLLFTVGFSEFLYLTTNEKTTTFWGNLFPNTVAICFALFIAAKSLLKNRKSKKLNEILSKRCFGLYLVHAFVLAVFQKYLMTWFWEQNLVVIIPILAIVVFLISFGISVLLSKIPLIGKWIAG